MPGPFYFAWIADGDVAFTVEHVRYDEVILALEVSQSEGNFAALNVTVRNPKVGLLGTDRYRWCWLSWDSVGNGNAADALPIFKGRIVGVPGDVSGELVQLEFLARADDNEDRKATAADALKVFPNYDPVWVDNGTEEVTPDQVLEGYSRLWDFDRLTLEVSSTDIINGEAGTIELTEDSLDYDGLSVSYSGRPIGRVKVTGTVTWQQEGEGTIDLSHKVYDALKTAGSPYAYPLVTSLTGQGLMDSWPKDGDSFGEGWTASGCSAKNATLNKKSGVGSNGLITTWANSSGWVNGYTFRVHYYAQVITSNPTSGLNSSSLGGRWVQVWDKYTVDFPVVVFSEKIGAAYRSSRKRTEVVKFTLEADLQEIDNDLTMQATEEKVDFSSDFVGKVVDSFSLTTTVALINDSTDATLASTLDLVAGTVYGIKSEHVPLGTTFVAPDNAGGLEEDVAVTLSAAATSDATAESCTITPDGVLPIGDLRRNSYFKIDRGKQSFEYLLYVARARLLAKARAVEVKVAPLTWQQVAQITLRHNAKVHDDRLPGGQAIGKVTGYSLSFDDGAYKAEVTMKCACGKGSTLDFPADATGCYALPGYMLPGYQRMVGGTVTLDVGDVQYQSFDDFAVTDDDGLDLFNMSADSAVKSVTVTNGLLAQCDLAFNAHNNYTAGNGTLSGIYADPIAAVKSNPTTVKLELASMTGEFKTTFEPTVSKLIIPRSIDLEAP